MSDPKKALKPKTKPAPPPPPRPKPDTRDTNYRPERDPKSRQS